MSTAAVASATLFLGCDSEGSHILTRVELREGDHSDRVMTQQTTEHGRVTNPLTVSVIYELVEKGHRHSSAGGAGFDAYRTITQPATGWTLADLATFADMAQRWHLNTMRGACAHQTVVWEDHKYGRRPSLTLTEPCPHFGYRYGSEWLAEVVPPWVVAYFFGVIASARSATQALYRERGYDGAGKAV